MTLFAPSEEGRNRVRILATSSFHFLVVETKNVGADIPLGQKIAFERLHKLGVFTIMFIWGKPQPEFAEAWYPTGEKVQLEGVDQITDFVRRWYSYAERNPFPKGSK